MVLDVIESYPDGSCLYIYICISSFTLKMYNSSFQMPRYTITRRSMSFVQCFESMSLDPVKGMGALSGSGPDLKAHEDLIRSIASGLLLVLLYMAVYVFSIPVGPTQLLSARPLNSKPQTLYPTPRTPNPKISHETLSPKAPKLYLDL